jgi:hypothetical protein
MSTIPASTAGAVQLCDVGPDIKVDNTWIVDLQEGACVNFGSRLDGRSRTLKDGSRGEMFQVFIDADECVRFRMTSDDFAPDLYIYSDSQQNQEVGTGRRQGNQYATVLQGTGASASLLTGPGETFDLPSYFVLATSAGDGEQFGSFQMDIRGC